MSEQGPQFESSAEVDLNSERLTSRLVRLYAELEGLENDLAVEVTKVALSDTSISRAEFNVICNRVSLRHESLLDWDDEYFDEQFDETVRIAKERRSFDVSDGE